MTPFTGICVVALMGWAFAGVLWYCNKKLAAENERLKYNDRPFMNEDSEMTENDWDEVCG